MRRARPLSPGREDTAERRSAAKPRTAAATATVVIELQRAHGNAAVGRMLRTRGDFVVLARTRADVTIGGANRGTGQRAAGGIGGHNHAEQLAWQQAQPRVTNEFARRPVAAASVDVGFHVDASSLRCQDWFENLHATLATMSAANSNRPFSLTVTVTAPGGGTVIVRGVDETDWPAGVGDQQRDSLITRLRDILTETNGIVSRRAGRGTSTETDHSEDWLPDDDELRANRAAIETSARLRAEWRRAEQEDESAPRDERQAKRGY